MNVLEIKNATKRFGNLVAVREVSLNVAKGELCAIIGPNGAGKTTFLNLISGFFPPTLGTITFDARDITRLSMHERVMLGMARTFQITEIFPELSVFENVRIALGGGRRLSFEAVDQPCRNRADFIAKRRSDAQMWFRWRPRRTGWSANSPTAISAPPRSRWR